MATSMKGSGSRKEPAAQFSDVKDLLVGYAKQETVDPIKGLGRFLGYGLAAALVGSLGLVLLLLGALRLLQTETGSAFDGRLTWIPYVLVVIVSAAIAGAAVKGRSRGQRRVK